MATEDEVNHMLPVQQLTLARAALAGITYERVNDSRRVHGGVQANGNYSRGRFVQHTKVYAKWPDGSYVSNQDLTTREFEDEFEAAVFCLSVLDAPTLRIEKNWPTDLFKVKE